MGKQHKSCDGGYVVLVGFHAGVMLFYVEKIFGKNNMEPLVVEPSVGYWGVVEVNHSGE